MVIGKYLPSFAPPCRGPYSAPTAPATALYTSTPELARCRAAAVEQFISCSACRRNIVSSAFANRAFGRWCRSRPAFSMYRKFSAYPRC